MKKQYLISLLGLVALFIPLGNGLSNTNYSASTSEINEISSNASFEENKLKIDDTGKCGDYYYEYEIQQISAGQFHSAALVEDTIHPNDNDVLYTWGANDKGQLGLGSKSSSISFYNTPQKVTDLPEGDIEQISMGGNHSAAIINDENGDHLYTWGYNSDGQLGLGDDVEYLYDDRGTEYMNTPQEVIELSGKNIEQISMGNSYSAVVADNELYTWGDNYHGELGLGKDHDDGKEFESYNTPQKVTSLPEGDIEQISIGGTHSAAVISDSSSEYLYTWGQNQYGQLGLGDNENYNTPQTVGALSAKKEDIEQISMGGFSSSAIISDDSGNEMLYTWGLNNAGQLGDGTQVDKNEPTKIFDSSSYENKVSNIKNISMAKSWDKNASHSTAIVTLDGEDCLFAWGGNKYGQLGYESNDTSIPPVDNEDKPYEEIPCSLNPNKIDLSDYENKSIKNATTGAFHNILILSDENNDYLYTWGNNEYHQLGLGKNETSSKDSPQYVGETIPFSPSSTEIDKLCIEQNEITTNTAILSYEIILGKDVSGNLDSVTKIEWIDTEYAEGSVYHNERVLDTVDSNLIPDGDQLNGNLKTNKLYPNTTYKTKVVIYSSFNGDDPIEKEVESSFKTKEANEPGTIETIGDPIIKTNTATISYVINPAKNFYGEPMKVDEVKWMAVTDGNPDNDIQIGSDTPENYPSDGKETITGKITTDSDLSKNAVYKETYLIVDGKHESTDDDYQPTPYFSVKTGNFLTRNLIISASVIVVIIIIIAIILFFVFKWWKKRVIT